jgi:hypothetical protein
MRTTKLKATSESSPKFHCRRVKSNEELCRPKSRILEPPSSVPDGSNFGDHSADPLNPAPSIVSHLGSPSPHPTSSYMGMRSRPSSFELLKRVSNARKVGKSLDEMIHELQNDLYPLIAPANYRAPSPGSYRITVLRLEKWNDMYDSIQKELDEDMDEEKFNSNAFQVKIGVKTGCRPPCYVSPMRRVGSGSWSSALVRCLALPASLCAGKRRKREPELDNEDRFSGSSTWENRKRRRAM